ncbi:MAG: thymidine phosphorylase family protein [Planctomycetota bacterium]|jgi:thymidine phosphorylase
MTDAPPPTTLRARRMGIDTQLEHVIYMRADCPVCRSEGFEVKARVLVTCNGRSAIATLNVVDESLLRSDEAGLSQSAWEALGRPDGDAVTVEHAEPVDSLRFVRAKLHGRELTEAGVRAIVRDSLAGRFSEVELTAFLAASAGSGLNDAEVTHLTRAMIDSGQRLDWGRTPIADKHCIGGLPGNRTTLLVVPIVAAAGGVIPKTSSRAITSPAGTADTMEVLAPVDHDLLAMRRIVEREGGCIVWGSGAGLSPADDLFVRIERALDIDSPGQLVASILSKKAAAGATHVVIDIPLGPTAKTRSHAGAERLRALLTEVGSAVGLTVQVMITDGAQPVGRGIGPALEARDVLAVLRGERGAPADLRERSVALAGALLEMTGLAVAGGGAKRAGDLLADGSAERKFLAICDAQGGMRDIPEASHRRAVLAGRDGVVRAFDNRRLAKIAKLAGAPADQVAGLDLHVALGSEVDADQPLYTIHADSPGELDYSLNYALAGDPVIEIGDPE